MPNHSTLYTYRCLSPQLSSISYQRNGLTNTTSRVLPLPKVDGADVLTRIRLFVCRITKIVGGFFEIWRICD